MEKKICKTVEYTACGYEPHKKKTRMDGYTLTNKLSFHVIALTLSRQCLGTSSRRKTRIDVDNHLTRSYLFPYLLFYYSILVSTFILETFLIDAFFSKLIIFYRKHNDKMAHFSSFMSLFMKLLFKVLNKY